MIVRWGCLLRLLGCAPFVHVGWLCFGFVLAACCFLVGLFDVWLGWFWIAIRIGLVLLLRLLNCLVGLTLVC